MNTTDFKETVRNQLELLRSLKVSIETQIEALEKALQDDDASKEQPVTVVQPTQPPAQSAVKPEEERIEVVQIPHNGAPLYEVLKRAKVSELLPDSTLAIVQVLIEKGPKTIVDLKSLTRSTRAALTGALNKLQTLGVVQRIRVGNSYSWFIHPDHLTPEQDSQQDLSPNPAKDQTNLDQACPPEDPLLRSAEEYKDVGCDDTLQSTAHVEDALAQVDKPAGAIYSQAVNKEPLVPLLNKQGKPRSDRQLVHYYAKNHLKMTEKALAVLKWFLVDNQSQPCTLDDLAKGLGYHRRKVQIHTTELEDTEILKLQNGLYALNPALISKIKGQ